MIFKIEKTKHIQKKISVFNSNYIKVLVEDFQLKSKYGVEF